MYIILKNNIMLDSEEVLSPPKDLPSELIFITGCRISIPVDDPVLFSTDACAGDKIRDFYGYSFPIVSKRFLNILRGAGVDNLQVFPVVIQSEIDGTVWKDYFLINIVGLIACADLERSVYDELMPGSYMFDELAIYPEKAKGSLLFRLQEDPATIIIDRDVGMYIKSQDPDNPLLGWAVGKILQ